jgi:hypothetical protein
VSLADGIFISGTQLRKCILHSGKNMTCPTFSNMQELMCYAINQFSQGIVSARILDVSHVEAVIA